jgi:NitT/TauT family transport system ATP-binding protein
VTERERDDAPPEDDPNASGDEIEMEVDVAAGLKIHGPKVRAKRLGDILIEEGLVTRQQIAEALERQKVTDIDVGKSVLDKYWREHYPPGAADTDWVVSFEHVTKRFGRYTAVSDINFKIYDIPNVGEFICVLGPSGCGKSTILNMISGFYGPTEGTVKVKGKVVTHPGSDRGMVFQTYSSFPNLRVWENVSLGLMLQEQNILGRLLNPFLGLLDPIVDGLYRLPYLGPYVFEHVFGLLGRTFGVRRHELKERAMEWIRRVELKHTDADKYPHELSGGMRQRVAIARTLACKPRVLLMDEPFGALDRVTRWEMQDLLVRIWREVEATVFLITHDLPEAVYLGDRVFILSDPPGRLVEEVPLPTPSRPAAEMQRTAEFNKIVNEISAKVERSYFQARKKAREGADA